MPLPRTPEEWDAAAKAMELWAAQRRREYLDLMGRWVSGLEPELIYGRDILSGIKGVGIAGDPSGRIVVANPAWRPGFLDRLYGQEIR